MLSVNLCIRQIFEKRCQHTSCLSSRQSGAVVLGARHPALAPVHLPRFSAHLPLDLSTGMGVDMGLGLGLFNRDMTRHSGSLSQPLPAM